MNTALKASAFAGAGLLIGVMGTLFATRSPTAPEPVWFAVDSDVPLVLEDSTKRSLPIKHASGRVTLVAALDDSAKVQTAYVITLALEPVTDTTFPIWCRLVKGYKEQQSEMSKGQKGRQLSAGIPIYDTESPIHEVWLRVTPNFKLKDSDGFILATVEGEPHVAETGKEATLQAVSSEMLPPSFRTRIQSVEATLVGSELICSRDAG